MLFIAGLTFLQRQDFELARVWIEQAAGAATYAASHYHEKDSPEFFAIAASGNAYKVFYDLSVSIRDLNACRYRTIFDRSDELRGLASVTVSLYEKAINGGYKPPPHALPTAQGLRRTIEVIPIIASIMNKVFQSTFKPDIAEIKDAKSGMADA